MLWAALPTAAVPLCPAKRHLRNLGLSPATLSRKAQTALQAKSDLAAEPRGSTPSRPCHGTLKAGDHSAVSKQRLLCRANVVSATEKQQASSRSEFSADTWNLDKRVYAQTSERGKQVKDSPFALKMLSEEQRQWMSSSLGADSVCPLAHGCL